MSAESHLRDRLTRVLDGPYVSVNNRAWKEAPDREAGESPRAQDKIS
jgi:hypothetical protein